MSRIITRLWATATGNFWHTWLMVTRLCISLWVTMAIKAKPPAMTAYVSPTRSSIDALEWFLEKMSPINLYYVFKNTIFAPK